MHELLDDQPRLTVIIVSYVTRAMTLECLKVLHRSLAGLLAEVIVVDNASNDGSVAAIRDAFPAVNVIANAENRGFAAANNQAIRVSRGDYVLLLNSDAFPKPDAVQRLVGYLDANPVTRRYRNGKRRSAQ